MTAHGDCCRQHAVMGLTMMSRRLPTAEAACIPVSSLLTAAGDRYMTRPSRIQQVGTSGSKPFAVRLSTHCWFSRSTEQLM